MTNGPDKNSKDELKGFAGLSSMISDVEASFVDEGRPSTTVSSGKSRPTNAAPAPTPEPEGSRAESQAHVQPQSQPEPQARTGHQAPSQPTGNGSGGKWLIGIAVVIGLIWLASLSDKKTPAMSSSYSTSASSSSAPVSPTARPAPVPPVQAPSRPSEELPPFGSGNVLTPPQIRYCTAQNIRLDAAREAVNQYNASDINRFNALIHDYNSRCSSFRYRKGALESARNEVERFRSDYLAQGRQLFAP